MLFYEMIIRSNMIRTKYAHALTKPERSKCRSESRTGSEL